MTHHKANLFIVGAMKAGTTSLMDILARQDAIYASPIKEPHYFTEELPEILYEPSRFFSLKGYFDKEFPKPLHIAKVQSEEQYQKLFSLRKDEKYLLEASTMYLHHPGVAQKIAAYNPEAKIIILKRDPLERTFSHYRMLIGLSRENRSFEEVISEEIKKYHQGTLPWYSYIGMSFYKKAIAEYKKYFKEVLVLDFQTFVSQREKALKILEEFLQVPLQNTDFDASGLNKTRTPKFQKLFLFLKRLGVKDYFSAIFSSKLKQRVYVLLSSDKKEKPNLKSETYNTLQEIFLRES